MAKHMKPVKLGSPFPKGYKSTWWHPGPFRKDNGKVPPTDRTKPCSCEQCRPNLECEAADWRNPFQYGTREEAEDDATRHFR